MCLPYKFFENTVRKGEIAHNELWVLCVCRTSFLKTLRKGEIAHNEQFLLFIRSSKTGRIMGSPVAGVWAGGRHPVLCPEHISKTTLARVMKFHRWIDLIQGECSAQES